MNKLKCYISMARPDHWFKNIFMFPGLILAFIYSNTIIDLTLIYKIIIGVLSTCLIASANYVINEWLDAGSDKHHPLKKNRPSVKFDLQAKYVYLEYLILVITALTLSSMISLNFFLVELFFLIMGLIYNVKPLRTKDKPYLDVLSESINNPIRLLLGWLIMCNTQLPPSSIFLAYWMGGAFLMATKRFAEYRFINDPQRASLYRKSFKYYSEENLLISIFFYALCASFFLGVFLVKHRMELLLSLPFLALLFSWYLKIGFNKNSTAQNPENLFKEKKFIVFSFILTIFIMCLFFIDIPWLKYFLERGQ